MAKANKTSFKPKPVTAKSLKSSKTKKSGSGFVKKVLTWVQRIFFTLLLTSFGLTFIYRYINPPFTPLMLIRTSEQIYKAEKIKWKYKWVDLKDMSPFVAKAALAAEDQKFYDHNGFDFDAIYTAFQTNQFSKKIRGGSTITQQTAKNVFLWPGRSWLRKGLEAYFTFLIEFMWPKERILEIYLNVIEMGKGVYGAEAAANTYYYKSCKNLTKAESAAIASIFPLPLKWDPVKPSPYLHKKQDWIRRQADYVILKEF
ncbi:MAG: monofunctional biosynthetic peptidoglycan transglycosylase [Opitutaceae bacterium]|nr:monofunctional biosynthetic peptidoglycan transglycosylase [Cytophagales bacterium]